MKKVALNKLLAAVIIATSIDNIVETIAYKYFNDDLEKMQKETELLDCNMLFKNLVKGVLKVA
ncbi:hypothetical protein [Clostridium botulinum]|uniref:hypothetical protein n=1 Tax=Clostridium botulinum TaxID=1491 RepID=UPI001967784F|nr:hypothetical protein [Clostridium botulinum]MBN1049294.1 hypothetical protein [Clostridium botulinum]